MATKKVTTPDLKSKNGLSYKQLLRNDKLIVLTTADNKIGLYESSGKCLALLDAASVGGKVPPTSFQASADGKSVFFLDDQTNLQYLDLSGADIKTSTLMKGVKADRLILSGDELLYLKTGTGLIENLKKEGAIYKETPKDVPNPASCKDAKATGFGACGKELVLITYDNGKGAVFNSKKDSFAHEDLFNLPKFNWDHSIYLEETRKLIFGVSVGAVIQYSVDSKDVTKQYASGQYGDVQNFGVEGDFVYLVTGTHFLVFKIGLKKGTEAELIDVLKFKFVSQNPGAKIFFNLADMLHLTFIAGDQVDTLRLSPIWEKVEREPLRISQAELGKSGAQPAPAKGNEKTNPMRESDIHSKSKGYAEMDAQNSDDPDHYDDGYKPKTKGPAKKKKVVKNRKQSFDLNGMHHMKSHEYNALRDEHLKSYFYSYRIRGHLIKQNLVTCIDLDHKRWVHNRKPRRV
jgi:hypothetical protein